MLSKNVIQAQFKLDNTELSSVLFYNFVPLRWLFRCCRINIALWRFFSIRLTTTDNHISILLRIWGSRWSSNWWVTGSWSTVIAREASSARCRWCCYRISAWNWVCSTHWPTSRSTWSSAYGPAARVFPFGACLSLIILIFFLCQLVN